MRTLTIIIVLVIAATAQATPPEIRSREGKYLGDASSNQFDPNSVSNPFGKYGSPYEKDSVNNQFGRYGSPFSNDSVNNPFATGGSRKLVDDRMQKRFGSFFPMSVIQAHIFFMHGYG
jgi:hypothetical protein